MNKAAITMMSSKHLETPKVTLADLLRVIEKDGSLPIQTKRDLASALRKGASWMGPDGLSHPADPGALAKRMRTLSPAMLGISSGSMANLRYRLRRAFKLGGIPVRDGKQTNALSPDWIKIQELVGVSRCWRALSAFAHFASSQNWSPSQIDNTHLEMFRSVLTNGAIHGAPDRAIDQLRKSWNECATKIPDWPGMPLNSLPRRIPYVIKEAILPEGLRHQINDHFQRLEKPAIFGHASGPSKTETPFAPSNRGIASTTVERQRYQLRQYLSALVAKGMQLHEMTDLAKLVRPNLVEQGLMFFYERAGQRVSSQLELIALVLIGIAERYLNNKEVAKEIRGMLKNARTRRRPREMSAKVRERLRQFDDHRNLMGFLKLPSQLVKLAHAAKSTSPIRAARLFECAFAIELMTNCPIRIGNVAGLNLDKHFCKSHPGPNGIVHLVIPFEEVKNRRAIEFEVPSNVMQLFKSYLEEFRPHLPGASSRWLFPQADGTHLDSRRLGTRISRAIRRYTGIRMNSHMFRHVAAETMEATPGGHELVRHLLGHTSSITSERFYIRRNMDKAIRHYTDTILKARRGIV